MYNFEKEICVLPVSEEELPLILELFNEAAENELPYKRISVQSCRTLFFSSSDKYKVLSLYAKTSEGTAGFISGCLDRNANRGYITFLYTVRNLRRQGIGTRLLLALEEEMKNTLSAEAGTQISLNLQISFFNPCALTWIVPETPGHDHPNAPGVDAASAAYLFFKNRNFIPTVYQNSFYLPLDRYEEPFSLAEKKARLLAEGIEICLFDCKKHKGLEELTDDLGNPVWKEELLTNEMLKENAAPVAAAIRNSKIIGFTGPLRVQESGRGYFAGIGVHSGYRGFGLGNVLFHTLCRTLKEMGASYMTLFTGETNPAGQIYRNAGFKIVKSWADMDITI